ncbi:hypothetical protein GCM10011360_07990 [Primorskyibacter flagellatus]|uniref:VPLPA-CTERM protein sorting domain-containing protein n=1 Tax=Primorskyibacter flagellatus TaxID=1387277 RepID=A0A917EDL9_9RHOB|nr:VPLPA-CTERM sorting domain-containing protein [Primorskyibacter flagellatus]GGE21880.1 hypothetical protein GCM10011360_07990 [Primorskyibacter flagellatus]
MTNPTFLGTTLALSLLAGTAQSAVFTYDTAAAFATATAGMTLSTEDFEDDTPGSYYGDGNSVDVGGFSLSSDHPNDAPRNTIDAQPLQFPEFNVNGSTVANILYGLGTSLTLTFDSPIFAFGAMFADLNNGVVRTEIDVAGATLTPAVAGIGEVRFFGFVSDAAFSTITFRGVENDGYGMDDVVYGGSAPAIPLPAGLPLLLTGLFGLGALRRRG